MKIACPPCPLSWRGPGIDRCTASLISPETTSISAPSNPLTPIFAASAIAATKHVALQGSISAVGGHVMLSRPITDAFALVQVDGLEGVDVYQGSQHSGTTDKNGRLLIPSLGSFVNSQIAVDSRDIPLDFELNNYTQLISLSLRGGAVLDFGARKIRAITGVLNIRRDGQVAPVKYGEISLLVDGKRSTHPVGRQAGDFFIENLEPATYNLSYVGRDGVCSLTIEVPDSEEPIIDFGKLLCVSE